MSTVLLHGSKSPTWVLISLEFDSHLSGVNQDKISLKSKTAHNVCFHYSPASEGEGRESLFFSSYFSRARAFSDSLDLTRGQATGHLSPVTSIARGEFHTQALYAIELLPLERTIALEGLPGSVLLAIVDSTCETRITALRMTFLCSGLPRANARVPHAEEPWFFVKTMRPTSPAGMTGKGIVCSRKFEFG